ncbi:MAG: hypothetical protein ACYCYA_03615 [Actinomycetes bacterium]
MPMSTRARGPVLRGRLRAGVRRGFAVLGVAASAGLPWAVLWWALAPRARYSVTAGGASLGERAGEALVGADVVFGSIGVVVGLGAALVLGWRRRDVATTAGLGVGLLLAGLVAEALGHLAGPGSLLDRVSAAPVGARVTEALDLHAMGVLTYAPVVAMIINMFLAVWSSDPPEHSADS